MQTINVDVVA